MAFVAFSLKHGSQAQESSDNSERLWLYYMLSFTSILSRGHCRETPRDLTESHRRKEWLTFFVFHAAAPCNLTRFSRRQTVVRLATEQDVTVGRGSTPHTTAKVLDNLNSAKPRLRQDQRLDCLLANKKAHQGRPKLCDTYDSVLCGEER